MTTGKNAEGYNWPSSLNPEFSEAMRAVTLKPWRAGALQPVYLDGSCHPRYNAG